MNVIHGFNVGGAYIGQLSLVSVVEEMQWSEEYWTLVSSYVRMVIGSKKIEEGLAAVSEDDSVDDSHKGIV